MEEIMYDHEAGKCCKIFYVIWDIPVDQYRIAQELLSSITRFWKDSFFFVLAHCWVRIVAGIVQLRL